MQNNNEKRSPGFFGDDPWRLLKAWFVWQYTFCVNQKMLRVIMTHRWWQFANVLGVLGLCLGFLAVLIFVIGRFIHPEFMSDVTFAGALLNVLEGGLFFYVAAIITYFFAIPFFYDPNWKER